MKKLLLLLMALLLAFSLIACGDDETTPSTESSAKADKIDCAVHFDGNKDGKCDNCGEATKTSADGVGAVLAEAVSKQFENAQTLTLEVNFNLFVDSNTWTDMSTNETTYLDGVAKLIITAAKTETGCNLKIDADIKSKDSKDGEFEVDSKGTVFYLIDGMTYSYKEDEDKYLASPLEIEGNEEIEAATQMFNQIFNGVEIPEEEINAIVNELGTAVLTSFNVKENKGNITVDLKPTLDALLSYIKSIDFENDTVGDILDDILAHVSEDLTANDAILSVESILGMTVSEFIEVLDGALTDAYGKTIQELYESIITNEQVQQIIINAAVLSGEVTEAEVKEMLEAYAALEIVSLIPEELMGVPVYDLIMSMVVGTDDDGNPVSYPTLEENMGTIKQIIAMPLVDFAALMEIDAPLELITMIAEGIKINALNTKIDIKFQGTFQLEYITSTTTVDFVADMPTGFEGKSNKSAIKCSLIIKLSNISTAKTEIKAPTNLVTVE